MADIVRFLLRLPAELHAEMKDMADQDRRSLHAEILVLLEEAVAVRRDAATDTGSKLAA
jgi:hypothetical protein